MKIPLCLFVGLLFCATATAQSPTEHRPCSLATFDGELRDALSSRDAARIALLVDYPLRVNDAGGSLYFRDAASLQGHFNQVFTPAVRKAILGQSRPTDCNAYTFIYGNGEAAANLYQHGYAIGSVNVSLYKEGPKGVAGQVEFACRTKAGRIVVDHVADGSLRLRAWNIGQLLVEKPDTDIAKGKKEIEGTGGCTHEVWTFESGATEFVVSERGCYPDSNEPPAGAHGQFAKHSGKNDESWWCF